MNQTGFPIPCALLFLLSINGLANTPIGNSSPIPADSIFHCRTAGSLNEILNRAENSRLRLIIEAPLTADADRIIPNRVTLEIKAGGRIFLTSGTTLVVNGVFTAPPVHCFYGEGHIQFSDSSMEYAIPEWWGAQSDGKASSSMAINRALESYRRVRISTGNYRIDSPIFIQKGNLLFGVGADKSRLFVPRDTGTKRFYFGMIEAVKKDTWEIRDLVLDNSANYPNDSVAVPNQDVYPGDHFSFPVITGIWIKNGGNDWKIESCRFKGMTGYGIRAHKGTSGHESYQRVAIVNNRFFNGSYAGKVISVYGYSDLHPCGQVSVRGNVSNRSGVLRYVHPGIGNQNASTDGIDIQRCDGFEVLDNVVDSCAGAGIRVEHSQNGNVAGNLVRESGASGIDVYNNSRGIRVIGNTIQNWGRIPNLGSLRRFNGEFYLAREAPQGPKWYPLVPLPADPSTSAWFEANPYSFHGASKASVPDYNVANYYYDKKHFAGKVSPPHGFDSPSDQGILPFRGYAAICVSQFSRSVVIDSNEISGSLRKSGGLYDYASDYGIMAVHSVNFPQSYEYPLILGENRISGVIKAAIYTPDYCDPVNKKGRIKRN